MKTKKAQYGKVIQKRETKKSRLIVSTDLETHWKEDYLQKAIWEPLSRGSKLSTLFMTSKQTRQFWADMADFSDGSIREPLDQSKFDQEQTKNMVNIVYEERGNVILDLVDGPLMPELWEMNERVRYAGTHGYIQVPGFGRMAYKNGILSGKRDTAFLDTIINAAVFEVALEEAKTTARYVAQGDDLQTRFDRWLGAVATWALIQDCGFKVNPAKFFISDTRDEFLRKVAEPGVVFGYPARCINSLLWRNPVNDPPAPGKLRLGEMLDQWHTLVNRFDLTFSDIMTDMVKDMARANQMKNSDVYMWLHTPAAIGGGGLVPETVHDWAVPSDSIAEGTVVIGAAPGLDSIKNVVDRVSEGAVTSRVVDNWARTVIGVRFKEFTHARMGSIAPAKRVNIWNIDGKVDKPELDPIERVVWGMDPKALGERYRFWPPTEKLSDTKRGEMLLGTLKLSVPRMAGMAYSYYSGLGNQKFLSKAEYQFTRSFRNVGEAAWQKLSLSYETWLARVWGVSKGVVSSGKVDVYIRD
jgi:hypothetical protein